MGFCGNKAKKDLEFAQTIFHIDSFALLEYLFSEKCFERKIFV